MTTASLYNFANPDNLKKIKPELLRSLLSKFTIFCHQQKLCLEELNYYDIAKILVTPNSDIPVKLVDALYFIYEISKTNKIDSLLEIAKKHNIHIDGDNSISDVAAYLWIKKAELLESLHAINLIKRSRSFEIFSAKKPTQFIKPSNEILKLMEKELNEWCYSCNRGKACKIFVFEDDNKIKFLIKHGMPFKLEVCIKDDKPDTIFYMPEVHDVLNYNIQKNELAINNSLTKKEKSLYLTVIGQYLFNDKNYFTTFDKLNLDPLKTYGEQSLDCSDIKGIKKITLTEVKLKWPGKLNSSTTRKSNDYFKSTEFWPILFPNEANLISATFNVDFENELRSRAVKIVPPNITAYTHDSDSILIEQWLINRGFQNHG